MKHNMNKTFAALAVAMLAAFAAPMATAHNGTACDTNAPSLATSAAPAPTVFDKTADQTDHGLWQMPVPEETNGASATLRIAAANADSGLVYEVYQVINGECERVVEKAPLPLGSTQTTLSDGPIALYNAPDVSGAETGDVFFIHVFVDATFPDVEQDYRLYKQ